MARDSDAVMEARAPRLATSALGSLGSYAGCVACSLAHRALDPSSLQGLGFLEVNVAGGMRGRDWLGMGAKAVLIVTLDNDLEQTKQEVAALDQDADTPVMLVAVLAESVDSVEAEVALGQSLRCVRQELMQLGADHVACLTEGDTLKPYVLMEIVDAAVESAKHFGRVLDSEVKNAKEAEAKRSWKHYQELLNTLPETALEHLPRRDDSLQETLDGDGKPVKLGEFSFGEVLGSGSFGVVYRASSHHCDEVAIKVFSKSSSASSVRKLIALDHEVGIMMSLPPHPNVVAATAVYHARRGYYLVMQYAGACNLHAFAKRDPLPKDVAASFGRQQALALAHLHAALVCHRDVKPTNWIVDQSGTTVRLADLGLAAHLLSPEQVHTKSCGSVPFIAPEVLRQSDRALVGTTPGYNALAADVWSLGLNFLELALGPYAIERALGWLPSRPRQCGDILAGLLQLPQVVCELVPEGEEDTTSFSKVLPHMVVEDAASRWSMGRIASSRGVGGRTDRASSAVRRAQAMSSSSGSANTIGGSSEIEGRQPTP